MPRKTKATLHSRWWRDYFQTIRHCFQCGGHLKKRYVAEEQSRRLVCVVCEQITYTNPKVVAGLLPVLSDGRVILARRGIEPALGRWTYPAGYLELGESVPEAAERETWEEICVRARARRLLGVYSYADAGAVTVVYVGELRRGEKPEAGKETKAVELFRPTQIPWKDLAFRSTFDALKDWLKTC